MAAKAHRPGDDFGGLTAKNWFGDKFNTGNGVTNFIFSTSEPGTFANEPNAGNRFVYGYQPTLTTEGCGSDTGN